jgi:hypothetical protein
VFESGALGGEQQQQIDVGIGKQLAPAIPADGEQGQIGDGGEEQAAGSREYGAIDLGGALRQ